MENSGESDNLKLVLNTKGCCLICLKAIPALKEHKDNKFMSLSVLLFYLKINVKNADALGGDNYSLQYRPDVEAQLCDECSKINQQTSKLVQMIAVAELKLSCYANSIQRKIQESGRTPSRMMRYQRRMKRNNSTSTLTSFEDVENLRKRVSERCFSIGAKSQPTVLVTKLNCQPRQSQSQEESFPVSELEDVGAESNSDNFETFPFSEPASPFTLNGDNNDSIVEHKVDLLSKNNFQLADNKLDEVDGRIWVHHVKLEPSEILAEEVDPEIQQKKLKSSNIVRQITTNGNRKCTICYKTLGTVSSLRNHMRIHTGDMPFECTVCRKRFRNRPNLVSHRLIHITECESRPRKRNLPQSPFHSSASSNNDNRTEMPTLPKNEMSMENRSYPEKPHNLEDPQGIKWNPRKKKNYKCPICSKMMSGKYGFTAHMKIHKGKKQFECDVCHKAFMRNDALHRHKRQHTGEMPFQCDFCSKRFRDPSNLHKHRQLHQSKLMLGTTVRKWKRNEDKFGVKNIPG